MADRTRQCFRLLVAASKKLRRSLSPREAAAFKAGLHAAHAEEALTIGDEPRSLAHFDKLLRLAKVLRKKPHGVQ